MANAYAYTPRARTFRNGVFTQPFNRIGGFPLSPDVTLPVVSAVSPAGGSSISAGATLAFHVQDNIALTATWVSAAMDDDPAEVVWNLGGEGTGYSATVTGNDLVGYDFSVARDDGWHGDLALLVEAIDTSGNRRRTSISYTAPAVAPPFIPAPPPETVTFVANIANATADFGLDVSTFPGVDPTYTLRGGSRVLLEAIARRFITPRGALPFAEDYGTDLRLWLSEGILDQDLDELKAAAEQEALKDERVFDASATVEFIPATETLKLDLHLDTAEGPFALVLKVSELTIELLSTRES